jgi:hypothetical protein
VPQTVIDWNNALDTKTVQIFSVGAILIAVSGLRLKDPQWWWQPWTFVLAVVAFLVAALNCYRVYRPIGLAVAPHPKATVDPELLALTPTEYRRQAIEDLAQDHDGKHSRLIMKSAQVRVALQLAAAEVLLLVLSLFRFSVAQNAATELELAGARQRFRLFIVRGLRSLRTAGCGLARRRIDLGVVVHVARSIVGLLSELLSTARITPSSR